MGLWAQFAGIFPREHLIKYTPEWKGERFADGRPKVPDAILKRLATTTSEEAAWGPLRRAGYNHQWEGGWRILNPDKKLVGRVFTCAYMPGRSEVSSVIEADAAAAGLSQSNVRVMDMLQPGDVVIADHYANITHGVFTGDNLAVAIWTRTKNGFVVNGGLRDMEATEQYPFPVYFRAPFPGTFTGRMLTGVNVPIRVGNVTVMPGDVVIGDKEGLTFVPPHMVEKIAEYTEVTQAVDEWRHKKFIDGKGKFKPSDLYGANSMRDPTLQKECKEFVSQKLSALGRSGAAVDPLNPSAYFVSSCGPPQQAQQQSADRTR